MEDYILKEINKIGKLIQELLIRMKLLKESNQQQEAYRISKSELLEKLNLDLDALLEQDDFIESLIREYGFNYDDLEKFGELLFDLIAASGNEAERKKLVANLLSIYKYLDANEKHVSFNRYYILKELEKFIP